MEEDDIVFNIIYCINVYGNPNASIQACIQPAGYVANKADCDGAYATVYPGAPEICGKVLMIIVTARLMKVNEFGGGLLLQKKVKFVSGVGDGY